MKKVLVIAYYYPPDDVTASVEASKFTKYLPEFGWQPVIVTTRGEYPKTLEVEVDADWVTRTRRIDVNALPRLAAGGRQAVTAGYLVDRATVRGRLFDVLGAWYRKFMNFPDRQIGWYPFALKAARAAVARHKPDAILSSAWPVTNHLVASRVAAETGLPWIADFRDLWTDNHQFQRSGFLRRVEERLERKALSRAAMLSAPSRTWCDTLQRRFPSATVKMFPNGFDRADYPGPFPDAKKFVLTYTGIWYPEYQDFVPVIEAVGRLRSDGVLDPDNFELKLVGRYLTLLDPLLDRHNVRDMTSILPSVSHSEALGIQQSSTALVVLLWKGPGGRGCHTAKLYEYMGAGRPLLAVGPLDTEPAELIEELGAGVTVQTNAEAGAVLSEWFAEFSNTGGLRCETNVEALSRYEWANIGREIAGALHEIVGSTRAEPMLSRL